MEAIVFSFNYMWLREVGWLISGGWFGFGSLLGGGDKGGVLWCFAIWEKGEGKRGRGYGVFICGWRWSCCFANGVNALGVSCWERESFGGMWLRFSCDLLFFMFFILFLFFWTYFSRVSIPNNYVIIILNFFFLKKFKVSSLTSNLVWYFVSFAIPIKNNKFFF